MHDVETMPRPPSILSVWTIVAALVVGAGCNESDRSSSGAAVTVVQDRLTAAFATSDTVKVIVGFRDPRPGPLSGANLALHREALRARGEQLARTYAPGFAVSRRYNHVPRWPAPSRAPRSIG